MRLVRAKRHDPVSPEAAFALPEFAPGDDDLVVVHPHDVPLVPLTEPLFTFQRALRETFLRSRRRTAARLARGNLDRREGRPEVDVVPVRRTLVPVSEETDGLLLVRNVWCSVD